MTTRNYLQLAGLLLLLWLLPVRADSPVWKISQGERVLYLGGTIHVLGPKDYPLPAAFDLAYTRASRLVFETDMQSVQDPEFQQAMRQAMLYPEGYSLQQVLKPKTWATLNQWLADRQLSSALFSRFRPGLVMIALTMMELQRLGVADAGVDAYFHDRARRDGKPLGQLETAQQQLEFIRAIGAGEEDQLILHTLSDLEQMESLFPAMKDAWRGGDLQALETLSVEPWRQQFPTLYRSLLSERNQLWLPQIEALLASPDVELVLVGALHLAGVEGLLAMLARRGYHVEQLDSPAP